MKKIRNIVPRGKKSRESLIIRNTSLGSRQDGRKKDSETISLHVQEKGYTQSWGERENDIPRGTENGSYSGWNVITASKMNAEGGCARDIA